MTDTEIADEGRIRALIGRAAYFTDCGEPAQFAEIYTRDVVWEMGDQRQEGVESIIAAAVGRRNNGIGGPGTHTKHVVVPMQVLLTSPDEAVATSYLMFIENAHLEPVVSRISTYDDSLRREPDGWRISHRIVRAG